jgi:hypothetical protein
MLWRNGCCEPVEHATLSQLAPWLQSSKFVASLVELSLKGRDPGFVLGAPGFFLANCLPLPGGGPCSLQFAGASPSARHGPGVLPGICQGGRLARDRRAATAGRAGV